MLLVLGCGPSVPTGDGGADGSAGDASEGSDDDGASMSAGGPGSLDASVSGDGTGSSDDGGAIGCGVLGSVRSTVMLDHEVVALATLDVDGDGSPPDTLVALTTNDLLLTFPAVQGLPVIAESTSPIPLGDVQRFDAGDDGVPDLLVRSATYGYVFEGDGLGGFALGRPAFHLGDDQFVLQLAVADLNGDGQADVAGLTLGESGDPAISVALATPSGDDPMIPWDPMELVAAQLLVADANGDGSIDLVTSTRVSSSITQLINDGGGGFTVGESTPASELIRAVAPHGTGESVGIVGVGTNNLALWRSPTLIEEWQLPTTIDDVPRMIEADIVGDGSLALVIYDSGELVVVRELDTEPCFAQLDTESIGPIVALELDNTPGLELVLGTAGAALEIVDFTP